MICKKFFGAIYAGLLFSAIPMQGATRVALVSTCDGDGGRQVLALAEAQLSAEPEMALVERTEVERVLREQKLWRCGLSSYDQAVAAGKLLGVDVFTSLEVLPNEKSSLGLVCFAADSGARLMDVLLPAGDPSNTVVVIVSTVQEACAKQQQPDIDRHTLCFLSVRNAELPRGLAGVCESVGRLLERRLLSSPSLAILERARLEQINKERALATDQSQTNGLLSSVATLELEFSRGAGSNDIHLSVFQTNPGGQLATKLQADSPVDRTIDLVDSLSSQLVQSLKASPLRRRANRNLESVRFCLEATFFQENGQLTQAVQAAEAALALAPTSTRARKAAALELGLAANAIGPGGGNAGPYKVAPDNLKQALALALRSGQICVDLTTEMTPRERSQRALPPVPEQEHQFLGFLERMLNVVEGFDAESRAQFTEGPGALPPPAS